jgi:hypothetical protein
MKGKLFELPRLDLPSPIDVEDEDEFEGEDD